MRLIAVNVSGALVSSEVSTLDAGTTWGPELSSSDGLPDRFPDGGRVALRPFEAAIFAPEG